MRYFLQNVFSHSFT